MRIAVADVGTNSTHLLIAEVLRGSTGGFRIIDTLKDRTKLGECLDEQGNLTSEGEERLAAILQHIQELASFAEVSEIRVYATSAIREAPNGERVAARMLKRTGIYPATISGVREGQLTYLGAAHSVEFGSDNLLLDLGGGSLEIVRGDQQQPIQAISLPLGSIRMTQAYISNEEIESDSHIKSRLADLKDHVYQTLTPYLEQFKVSPSTTVVLSSGTAEAAAEAIASLRNEKYATETINGFSFSVSELTNLLHQVSIATPEDIAKISGLERRTTTIVAGLGVLCTTLQALGAQNIIISEGALREGMLVEELSRLEAFTANLSTRQRSVLTVAERYRINLSHAQQVTELTQQLLSKLEEQGQIFSAGARSLLTAAATLHEAGILVSQRGHHKHSEYLIRHSGLQGFSPQDIDIIALIARYHRKQLPKSSHQHYKALLPKHQQLVEQLAAILRVADGLDRTHAGQASIVNLDRHTVGWSLIVTGANPLDLAGAREKADLWERTFGPLNIETTHSIS